MAGADRKAPSFTLIRFNISMLAGVSGTSE